MTSRFPASFTDVGTPVSGISECVRQPQSMYAWVALVLKSGFVDNETSAHARPPIVRSLSQQNHWRIKSNTGGIAPADRTRTRLAVDARFGSTNGNEHTPDFDTSAQPVVTSFLSNLALFSASGLGGRLVYVGLWSAGTARLHLVLRGSSH
jgi:hypothetical protein